MNGDRARQAAGSGRTRLASNAPARRSGGTARPRLAAMISIGVMAAVAFACSAGPRSTPGITHASGTQSPSAPASSASPTEELIQSVLATPSGGIKLAGTPGPPPDPSDLPGKEAPCGPGSAIALANGKILTWEGCWTVFDPATGIFTPTGRTTIPFQENWQPPNPAVLLKSGQVYFPNGEIYDPSTGRFYPIGVRLSSKVATLLPDGRVFVLAYDTTDPNEFVAGHVAPQIYDPRTGKATPTGPMPFQLDGIATTLPNGRVLVFGPAYPLETKQALLYDPATNTFSETGSTLIFPSCLTLLQDGRILGPGDGSRAAEVYDPATGRFAMVASMVRPMAADCVTLADGRVLALGTVGSDQDSVTGPYVLSAQIYDPEANHWTNLGPLEPKFYSPSLIALPDGRAVVLGGLNDTAQFFDPATNKFVANS
jgi:hypothetical protein